MKTSTKVGDASALQVVIFRDGNLMGSEVFLPGDYTVGCDADCELVLADESVGGCHAFLTFRDGKILLQGLGDSSIAINGQASREAEVRPLDDVSIGPFLLKFRAIGQKRTGLSNAQSARRELVSKRPSNQVEAKEAPCVKIVEQEKKEVVSRPIQSKAPTRSKPKEKPKLTVPMPGADRFPKLAERPKSGQQHLPAATSVSEHKSSIKGIGKETEPAGPQLRARVFWGKTVVGLYGFSFGSQVSGGASERNSIPLYHSSFPTRFTLAKSFKNSGNQAWEIRVPRGISAYRFDSAGWKQAQGNVKKKVVCIRLEPGQLLRIGDASYSLELRSEKVQLVPKREIRDWVRSEAFFSVGLALGFGILLTLAIWLMPLPKEQSDFNPRQLQAVRAVLRPPEKKKVIPKKEEKKEEKVEKKKEEKKEPRKKVRKKVANSQKPAEVKKALRAVKKLTSVPAVESLLKATSKIGQGPAGSGNKGKGYKLSPLIGKPPIAMAGIGFGKGKGGFGAATKGVRGMGGGGVGIGTFSAGKVGKRKVAGRVSAPPSRFKRRGGGGSLARDLIAKVINNHLGEVQACYERALLKESGLSGQLVFEWTIDTSGRVSAIKVTRATLRSASVQNCIVSSLARWVFPKPSGGNVVVSYPFMFQSVGF